MASDLDKDLDLEDAPPLPDYVPLAHDNEFLVADTFNVEDFLLSRSHTSLPDLRTELRDYLSTLKEELVKLINDDYEAFISLSTDLRGEGARLTQLKEPLGGLKAQILLSRNELQDIQDTIEEKLVKRATLREEKALLHLLMKISESVSRLESLLLISGPSQEKEGKPEGLNISSPLGPVNGMPEERSSANQAKHLARVASEYTQLLYHVSKARAEQCVFIDEIQWRIDRIQSTLSADLDHLFSTLLNTLTDDKSSSKVLEEKNKLMVDLTECLRTYDVLHLWRDAEDVLRREVMRPFVKKTVHPGALAGPHSPIMPHTPLPSALPARSATLAPHTPYTPFSAVHPKTPFGSIAPTSSSQSPYAYILADSEDSLSNLYNQILRYVDRDLVRIMLQAEKVSVKHVPSSRLHERSPISIPSAGMKSNELTSDSGFAVLSNVIWAEVGSAIMEELGSTVFATGRPNDFRKHHEKTQAFLRSLEFLAPSLHAVETLRAHPVFLTFERRWQLPVYFQMRWKEIVTKLEDSLSSSQFTIQRGGDARGFVTTQANAVWVAITACWSAEIFIPILSRYKTWLEKNLELSAVPLPIRSAGVQGPGSPSRASTPVSNEADTGADDNALLKASFALIDIGLIKQHTRSLWREEISMMLPDLMDINLSGAASPEDALNDALDHLTDFVQPLTSQVISILTKRSCDALVPVKSIPSQFRAMSNKKTPTEPSHFVFSILKPVKTFFAIGTNDGPGARLREEYMATYSTNIFEAAADRYASYVTSMRKTEESLRRLKKGKKNTFSLFGSSTGRDDDSRDEERIRTQLILDVTAFGKDGEALGVSVQESAAYKALETMVQTPVETDG